jgi:hypothetical protein
MGIQQVNKTYLQDSFPYKPQAMRLVWIELSDAGDQ